ncbi:glycosyltransferase [Pedobacter petrophilus]|uniref:Glycosyltransferase n=1 Tax=Pedobacter petrophilus TaxID=1908241 RepID=A0A7K0FWM0_9SPHI|nr:glycosyltransferase [Pedobacter petrophilus]MRX75620.1 glycosyltransferase [Pedobacter petrophilus]
MINLAIIIPAYKETYMEKALISISKQTNKNFKVYVGDDCSQYAIKSICDKFKNKINLSYHRFDTNLGRKDLVSQWHRCINLMNDEKWIWLFSDDDLADQHCVEKFYEALKVTNSFYDVYRFNTTVIDRDDKFISQAVESPQLENPMRLTLNILKWNRGNSMPDHIFKKAKYNELGGFINFIQAQGSDWATSINFSYPKGLYTIAGPHVYWRQSGQNISSEASRNKAKLIFGHLQFISWVNERFKKEDETIYGTKISEIKQESKNNLEMVIKFHYKGIPFLKFFNISMKISSIFKESIFKSAWFCLKINYRVFKYKY